MLSNLHTHSTYSDGKNTPEQIILRAISDGLSSIGFSDHGFTDFDNTYCMQDTAGYINELAQLREKYKDKIQVYVGVEEDISCYVDRSMFDYIIGSSHYFWIDGKFYPVDSNPDCFRKCIELFSGDLLELVKSYYDPLCAYIKSRRPDVIGHFDLVTKFCEIGLGGLLDNPDYLKLSEQYMNIALSADCMFEVNTGAISRGYRTTPYPYENLLYIIKKSGGKLTITSDSHNVDTLTHSFDTAKQLLKDIGFEYTYVLYNNQFKKDYLK